MGFFCKPKFDCLLPIPCLYSTPNPHKERLGFATKRSRGSLPWRLEDGGCANVSVVESITVYNNSQHFKDLGFFIQNIQNVKVLIGDNKVCMTCIFRSFFHLPTFL